MLGLSGFFLWVKVGDGRAFMSSFDLNSLTTKNVIRKSDLILFVQLGEVFGRIRVELLHAGLAAEFDLLAFVGFDDDLAHAAELVATDDAGVERVRLVSGKAGGGEGDEDGGEQCFHDVCVWVLRLGW